MCVIGKFQHYENQEYLVDGYQPQEYDLSKITVPIDLHYAENDWLAAPVVSTIL